MMCHGIANSIPTVHMFSLQLPKLLELVGLGYSAWFTYRYLLFKVRQCNGTSQSMICGFLLLQHMQRPCQPSGRPAAGAGCFSQMALVASAAGHMAAMQSSMLVGFVCKARACKLRITHSADLNRVCIVQSSREELIEDVEELKKKVRYHQSRISARFNCNQFYPHK